MPSANLEITKILAKVMQSSFKRKELDEIVIRIVNKMEEVIKGNRSEEYEELKKEFKEIKKEIEKRVY
ncbi:hypothetical protein NBO_73g0025 [Nosema bombycis CQ1]|uniref:Uncharacterized protein n=1 Tax=Nosema bombycis (strain CQ1 / CVCC 102059) TaxID=578461 RepID=R0M655_NOSB1|nr:hypothetical protein NBO_73g0025 [Nosema bombycis CQ1]|eukprot:EOB13459.1 hypothetical protein NBO_73g0025 [Nosema bombycis CQ1]